MTSIFIAGTLLFSGCSHETPADPVLETKTLKELTDLAEQGDTDALFQLGAIYHDGQKNLPRNLKKAREYFTKAAEKGDARSQFNLGIMQYSGEENGVPNLDAARQWFEKSAAQNDMRAQFNLGVMYYRAEGVKQDYAKALELFRNSALQGFAQAQFNLGVMLAKGEGTKQNVIEAYSWFTASFEAGNEDAKAAIENIERSLSDEEIELVRRAATELKDELQKTVKKT